MGNFVGTWGNDALNGTGLDDLILGLAGNDTIYGLNGDDALIGGAGADYISGGKGDDYLRGDDGDDSLFGGEGDDLIDGGAGADFIDGWKGIDTLTYETSNDRVWVSLDSGGGAFGHAEGDQIYGMNNLIGSQFKDWLQGNVADNRIEGRDGTDILQGLAGNDTLDGGNGDDHLDGGLGDDDLIGGHGDDDMYGRDGDDWFIPGFGDARVRGGDGIDTLDMRVFGDTGGWTIDGRVGEAKRLKSFWSLISIVAVISEEVEMSQEQINAFMAEAAQIETIETLAEMVEALELPGIEMIELSQEDVVAEDMAEDGLWPFVDIAEDLFGTEPVMQAFGDIGLPNHPPFDKPELFEPELGNSWSAGLKKLFWDVDFSDIENFVGSYGDDIIHGNELDNDIYGDAGDDQLFGHGGDDFLYSGGGNDSLDGGEGDDILVAVGDFAELTGGAGEDQFNFVVGPLNPGGGLRGVITDFEAGDLIRIEDSAANDLSLAENNIFSMQGDAELRVVQAGAAATVEMDINGDGTADWWIDVTLQDAGYTLAAADFIGL